MLKIGTIVLCRIGLHKWRDTWRGSWNGWTQDVSRQCVRCGKSEAGTFIIPLSGPRKGPLLKDEDK